MGTRVKSTAFLKRDTDALREEVWNSRLNPDGGYVVLGENLAADIIRQAIDQAVSEIRNLADGALRQIGETWKKEEIERCDGLPRRERRLRGELMGKAVYENLFAAAAAQRTVVNIAENENTPPTIRGRLKFPPSREPFTLAYEATDGSFPFVTKVPEVTHIVRDTLTMQGILECLGSENTSSFWSLILEAERNDPHLRETCKLTRAIMAKIQEALWPVTA